MLITEDKNSQIRALEERLSILEKEINGSKTEERRLIEKRNGLNDKFRECCQEIQRLKTERDGVNERVQNLKIMRDETRTKKGTVVKELRGINEGIRELGKKAPKRSNDDLKKELEEIEWKIQTTSLELEEEKRLIEEVKQLEKQLSTYKKMEKQRKKMSDLRQAAEELDGKANSFHKDLQETAQKSQDLHSRMITKITESKQTKAEADNVHFAYLQVKEKIEPAIAEWKKLHEQRRVLQELLREEQEAETKGRQQKVKEKILSEARSKLQRGEELSWNEFQLLSEDGSQTQNQS